MRLTKAIVLFSRMSETDFGESIKQIVEELAQDIQDQRGGADDESAVDDFHGNVS